MNGEKRSIRWTNLEQTNERMENERTNEWRTKGGGLTTFLEKSAHASFLLLVQKIRQPRPSNHRVTRSAAYQGGKGACQKILEGERYNGNMTRVK